MWGKARLAKDVTIIPWQHMSDLGQFGLTQADVQQRVYFVDAKSKVYGGSSALFRFGLSMKQPWRLIARMLLIPGVSLIAEPIYRKVAKNRHRMPGGTAACEMPPLDKPTD
jgi:predicted DCC family thiol-disulfide oxidoreductase YuxK